MQRFQVGNRVEWVSSDTRKEGTVVEVVAPGRHPSGMDARKLGLPRDHETYAVEGGERGRRKALYWPRVNLLREIGQLSAVEVAWCHEHAEQVRALMTKIAEG